MHLLHGARLELGGKRELSFTFKLLCQNIHVLISSISVIDGWTGLPFSFCTDGDLFMLLILRLLMGGSEGRTRRAMTQLCNREIEDLRRGRKSRKRSQNMKCTCSARKYSELKNTTKMSATQTYSQDMFPQRPPVKEWRFTPETAASSKKGCTLCLVVNDGSVLFH